MDEEEVVDVYVGAKPEKVEVEPPRPFKSALELEPALEGIPSSALLNDS
jgi:hypothetical protein